MSNQNVSKTILQYETDQSSVRKTVSSMGEIERALEDLEDIQWEVGKASIKMGDDIADGAKRGEKALEDLQDAAKGAGKSMAGIEGPDVGGALGTTASRTAQTRGALQAVGVSGAGTQFLEVGEAFADIGEVAIETGKSLGLTSKQMAGLGVAGAALTVALAALASQAAATRQQVASEVQGREAANQLIAQGDQQAIDARVQQIEVTRQGTAATLEYVNAEIARLETSTKLPGVIGDIQVAGNRLLGTGSENLNQLIELENQRSELTAKSEELNSELNVLETNVGGVADSSSEAATEIESIEDSVKSATPELDSFNQSVDESGMVADNSASQIDAANQKYADSVESAMQQASDAMSDAKRNANDSRDDLATALSDDLFDAVQENADERSDILTDSLRDDAQAARDTNRELDRIRRDGQRAEKDAARDRNFLALAQAREDAREALSDEVDAAQDEREERQIGLDQSLEDLQLSAIQERKTRLRAFDRDNRDLNVNLNRQLRDISTSRERQLQIAADALNKELALASQGANKKLELESKYYNASMNLIQKALSGMGASGLTGGGVGNLPTNAGALTGGGAGALGAFTGTGLFD